MWGVAGLAMPVSPRSAWLHGALMPRSPQVMTADHARERGSTPTWLVGKTYCQHHSRPALEYLRASAAGR